VLRSADVGDGAALANLYREVHTPPSGGNAEDHYPFPQYLNGAWIDQQIAAHAVYWIVAENHGEPIGTGAIIRIGEQADHAVEFRGFVVKPRYRRQGVATRIVRALIDRLGGSAAAMFAETRMTESGALKTFRKFGLLPIGLEPYAHKMSRGLESMVQLASVASWSMGLRASEGYCTPAVRRLAKVVLRPMGGRPLLAANPQLRGTVRPEKDDAILETVLDDRWPQSGGRGGRPPSQRLAWRNGQRRTYARNGRRRSLASASPRLGSIRQSLSPQSPRVAIEVNNRCSFHVRVRSMRLSCADIVTRRGVR
jgi:GNAT superfamily N-acetyltransferase